LPFFIKQKQKIQQSQIIKTLINYPPLKLKVFQYQKRRKLLLLQQKLRTFLQYLVDLQMAKELKKTIAITIKPIFKMYFKKLNLSNSLHLSFKLSIKKAKYRLLDKTYVKKFQFIKLLNLFFIKMDLKFHWFKFMKKL